jgi:VWFA-related protein
MIQPHQCTQRSENEPGYAPGRASGVAVLLVIVLSLGFFMAPCQAIAQENPQAQLPESPKPQKNAPPPPEPLPPATPPEAQQAAPRTETPAPEGTAPEPANSTESGNQTSTPGTEPVPGVQTRPAGTVAAADPGSREELFRLQRQVNFVTVPVTVKDRDSHLVEGLLANNFSVYEDGVRQTLKFFTSDPLPLSAALVIDMGMPDTEVAKVRASLPALVGAFGQFDEISIYSFGNTVKKWQDMTPADKVTGSTLRQLKSQKGRSAGAPVVGGPLGQPGPVINGRKMDNTPNIDALPSGGPIMQSRVLNDAILAAAQDLARRDRARRAQSTSIGDYRKLIFVVSDGRDMGSAASYADVMKVLLSNNIGVYAVAIGSAALPVYGKLAKVNVPKTGSGNILPKYASATGGQVFTEFGQEAIESAYSRVTSEARNQYTLGYTTRATPSSSYRSIEVRVSRPGLRVYARDGYYPLPPTNPALMQKKP